MSEELIDRHRRPASYYVLQLLDKVEEIERDMISVRRDLSDNKEAVAKLEHVEQSMKDIHKKLESIKGDIFYSKVLKYSLWAFYFIMGAVIAGFMFYVDIFK